MPAYINRNYSDLNLSFFAHPITGDVSKIKGVDAVKRSIRNLVLTGFYERPFQPELGSGVKQHLFENITVATQHNLKSAIVRVIETYEKRADLKDVIVKLSPDHNAFIVTIIFEVVNLPDPVSIDIFLERVR